MNSCILMAQIIKDPELRYTPDNQTAIAEILVQFPGLKADDPPATLKVVGWGNFLAQEIQRYHRGDRVVIEGSLRMNTIERSEGFKEKRAELYASRIHSLEANASFQAEAPASTATYPNNPNNVVPLAERRAVASMSGDARGGISEEQQTPAPDTRYEPNRSYTPNPKEPESGKDLDDIPF